MKAKIAITTLENSLAISRKFEGMYAVKPAILFVSIYPTDICTRAYIQKIPNKIRNNSLKLENTKCLSRTEKINCDIFIDSIP